MSEWFEKKMRETHVIHMNETRKQKMREDLRLYMSQQPVRTKNKVWNFLNGSRRILNYAAIIVVMLLVIGVGTNYAAAHALPGDVLYSTKIKVLEPLHALFLVTAEAKAEYAIQRANTRLEESVALAEQSQVATPAEKAVLTDSFKESLDEAVVQIEQITHSGNQEAAEAFRSKMVAHLEKENTTIPELREIARATVEQLHKGHKNNEQNNESEIRVAYPDSNSLGPSVTVNPQGNEHTSVNNSTRSTTGTRNGQNTGITLNADEVVNELFGAVPSDVAVPPLLQRHPSGQDDKERNNRGSNKQGNNSNKRGSNENESRGDSVRLQDPVSLPSNLNLPNIQLRLDQKDRNDKIEVRF